MLHFKVTGITFNLYRHDCGCTFNLIFIKLCTITNLGKGMALLNSNVKGQGHRNHCHLVGRIVLAPLAGSSSKFVQLLVRVNV